MVDIQAGSSPDHVYYDALEDPSDPPPAPSEPPLHLTWPDLANHPASCKPALIALEAAQAANIPYGYQHAAWSLGLRVWDACIDTAMCRACHSTAGEL